MTVAFYVAAILALLATGAVVVSRNAVHALLYLVVSLFAVAVVFYTVGGPQAAGREIIIYAGAIMVLFVFVVMTLNLREETARQEQEWLRPRVWIGPSILSVLLLIEVMAIIVYAPDAATSGGIVASEAVGAALFGPYVLAVEVASLLLLAALVGALHLGQRIPDDDEARNG